MIHLENVFLKNVLLYLPTLKDVGRFAQVSKSCEEAINTIYVNPYELTIHHSFDEIIPLFPNLQTFYVRRCPSRLYKITANDIPLIEVGGWNERSKQTKVFDTKWFCSKIRKIRIDFDFSMKVQLKHPNYFIQLQELVIIRSIDFNIIKKLIDLPTLKKVIIICNILEIQEYLEKINVNKHKQINFIIILNEYRFTNTNLLKQIDFSQFVNCRFYTRIFNKSTISLHYLPLLPYENKFLINFKNYNNTVYIESDILDKIEQINEIINKNNIQNVIIENILNNYEGNRIDLTSFGIESLSIQKVEKQSLIIVIPPNLKSLTIKHCKASIDISKCYLKKLILNYYQGKSIDINDDKLEKIEINSSQEIKWYHNSILLKENNIYVDTNKITSTIISYCNNFINVENNNNNNLQTIYFKYNDKETVLNNIQFFTLRNKNMELWNYEGKEIDFCEFPFSYINLQNCQFDYLKLKCNSIKLTNVECNTLSMDGNCHSIDLYGCTIDTITCDVIRYLTYKNSQITEINANEIMVCLGPKTKVKKWNIKNLKNTEEIIKQ
ncbi:hypothetical protein ENU1_173100 [Entamoeba nuttalli P19]|uniref:Uncharacterized protein n=1 Tax=Entamoeba nuttalli (strain P19) TaxID=1076696 RepID=K2G755_ENTNP|nr:hypothetical protein ENU1_173100 [Entamoeba nuttalli P19]EKE38221.1 hypothetical protein ENU1_173100 [Entamoeba nuttalli P19]|eukprot:XP_008859446.1 hypothetical protein ENU1_173100 [Entamoeba nuttalli P19]